jgi:hypothetical protein
MPFDITDARRARVVRWPQRHRQRHQFERASYVQRPRLYTPRARHRWLDDYFAKPLGGWVEANDPGRPWQRATRAARAPDPPMATTSSRGFRASSSARLDRGSRIQHS